MSPRRASSPIPPLLAEADAAWATRGRGSRGGRARPGAAEEVLRPLRAELVREPRSVEARWRLMRALYFAGEYAAADAAAAKASFLEASRIADEALALLRVRAGGSRADLTRATPVDLVPRLGGETSAAPTFEWSAVAWGMYSLAEGILAAALAGAATRVRDLAEATLRLDPAIDDDAGDRTLGRLHHKTPAVPFVTGWVSAREAVRHLRQAVAAAPTSLVNRLFLAEALHDLDSSRHDEAVAIAEAVVRDAPDPTWLVEHERARADARALLKIWRAAGR